MKARLRLIVVLLALVAALTACDLFTGINVQWTITGYGGSGSYATVNYSVTNYGRYDLTGVNLEIGAYVSSAGGYISDWTSDFSLAQGETKVGSINIFIAPYTVPPATINGGIVFGVDMDKP